MGKGIDWIVIDEYPGKPIGAVGFIGNEAAIIAAFYDAYDTDQDGKVSWTEWGISWIPGLNVDAYEITKVAMTARVNQKVLKRDGNFFQLANNIYLKFATGLISEGIYKAYLGRAVSDAGAKIAGVLAEDLVKQYLIKKGFGYAVKKALDAMTK